MISIQKPCRRTLFYSVNEITYRCNLPFPYLIFNYIPTTYFDALAYLKVGFCKEEPNQNTDIYFPPLPNIYGDWHVCIKYYQLYHEKDALFAFWESCFVVDNYNWLGNILLWRLLKPNTNIPPEAIFMPKILQKVFSYWSNLDSIFQEEEEIWPNFDGYCLKCKLKEFEQHPKQHLC